MRETPRVQLCLPGTSADTRMPTRHYTPAPRTRQVHGCILPSVYRQSRRQVATLATRCATTAGSHELKVRTNPPSVQSCGSEQPRRAALPTVFNRLGHVPAHASRSNGEDLGHRGCSKHSKHLLQHSSRATRCFKRCFKRCFRAFQVSIGSFKLAWWLAGAGLRVRFRCLSTTVSLTCLDEKLSYWLSAGQ